MSRGAPEQISKLQQHIEGVASRESYMGEQIPIKWLRFEQAVSQLVEDGTRFTSLDQVSWPVSVHRGVGPLSLRVTGVADEVHQ